MSTTTNFNFQLVKYIFSNPPGKKIKLFMLLFFVLTLGTGVYAQRPVCASMGTNNSVGCYNQVVTFTVILNENSQGQPLTWTINMDNPNNHLGPTFVNTRTLMVQSEATAGANIITVNTGQVPGVFTVNLKFDNYPEIGTCSASLKVAANCSQ